MSTKQELVRARDLIKAKDYRAARAILETQDHPTAKEWLARLDAIELVIRSVTARQCLSARRPG